jgi:hypothetical protein
MDSENLCLTPFLMTSDQLISRLSNIGVHPSSYSLGALCHNDCVCVVQSNRDWKVYYVERDKPAELGTFPLEDEAYDFVYATFCRWLGINRT